MWDRVSAQVIAHLKQQPKPLLAVLGPTASGKTDASIAIAKGIAATASEHGWQGCEIVNVDSRQLYRGLNLGTAKITAQEMQGVPHHLIDVLDPREELTIWHYKERAMIAIDDILSRHNAPMLVGGSMLYARAVIDDLQPPPAADDALRQRIQAEYDADGGITLHARLMEADPDTAATIDYCNKPSVVRACEILELTGKAPSDAKTKGECPYQVLQFLLQWKRADIVERINKRTKILLKSGWIEEVWGLLASGLHLEDPAMKSHGYREIASAILALGLPVSGPMPQEAKALEESEELYEMIAKKTRDYAKRQVTWWRPDERLVRIEMP